MKTTNFFQMRRALAVLVTGLALGEMLAPTAHASIYQMKFNYSPGSVPPFNAGGGVPAQAFLTLTTATSTNATLAWYGMMGWYGIQGSPDGNTFTTLTNVPASDFAWQATVPHPFTNTAFFRLSQSNSFVGSGECSGCHGDKYAEYLTTAHAVAFSDPDAAANFPLISRTVGFGQPTGFTDPTNTPFLENVGCENCHGPAGWHKNSDHALIRPAVSLDPAICGSCHQGSLHPTFEEYSTFGEKGFSHSNTSKSGSFGCSVCHSANNRMVMLNEYEDMLAGFPHPLNLYTGSDATLWTATCATCHDPHGSDQDVLLRYPTFSTNFFTMITDTDVRTVTNFDGSTSTVNLNTVFDSLYNPNIQVCGQCHNSRGARWDGTDYVLVTNLVVSGPVTNVVYVDILCTNTVTQVFTNAQGVPFTNTYTSIYVCGRYATNVVTLSQTNPVVGVGVITPLIAYTNGGVTLFSTNSTGYKSDPHPTPQYNILIGIADFDYIFTNALGVATNRFHPHSTAPNQCTDCHVPNYAVNSGTNVTGHTFQMDTRGCALAGCHTSYTLDALTAKIDNLQFIEGNNIVRVVSMLNQWATNKAPDILRTNYGPLAWEFSGPGDLGTIAPPFTVGPPSAYNPALGPVPSGTNDNLQLQIPQDIRMARFDVYMAFNDQSVGVHNPSYVQSLLDDAATRVSRQFTAANFSASTLAGFAPLTVKFSNLGTGIGSYNWSFGDTHNSTVANPTNVYTAPGIYSVTFTANGSETLSKTNYIRAVTAPTLSFFANQTNVPVGTTVAFTSTSINTNDVFRWTWYPRFNVSGAPSYDTAGGSPFFSYTYTNTGTFSVQLRATCPGGFNGNYNRIMVTNVAYITVHN